MDEHRYSIGDVVNGHEWTGTEWRPIQSGVGQVANGYLWNGTSWEPVAAQRPPSLQVTKQRWFWLLIAGGVALTVISLAAIILLAVTAKSPAYRQGYETAFGVLESFAKTKSTAQMDQYVDEMLGERRADLAAFCLGQANERYVTKAELEQSADGCVQAYRDWRD